MSPSRAVTVTLAPYGYRTSHAFVVTLAAPLVGVCAEVDSIHLYRPYGSRVFLRKLDLNRLPLRAFAQVVQVAWLALREELTREQEAVA
jgi:hypothetical protein